MMTEYATQLECMERNRYIMITDMLAQLDMHEKKYLQYDGCYAVHS
jgi:hypothetical protein